MFYNPTLLTIIYSIGKDEYWRSHNTLLFYASIEVFLISALV